MDLHELVKGLEELKEKCARLDELKSSRSDLADVLGIVDQVSPMLVGVKVLSLLAGYIGLTADEMASLRGANKG